MLKFLQTLQKEMVNFLIPFRHSCTTVALKLFSLILAKTRFVSLINFIGRCFQAKVIPIVFRVKFCPSNFRIDCTKYFSDVSSACNSFSRTVMRSTIRAMCSKRNALSRAITNYLVNLSNVCPRC